MLLSVGGSLWIRVFLAGAIDRVLAGGATLP